MYPQWMQLAKVPTYISMCIRSNKPLVLYTEVVKTTFDCLPMMQNLHRSSMQCLIPSRTHLLCRTRRPRSLMCPRLMCQSLIVFSFYVIMEASPITTLPITLYKFIVRSVLRTVIEPLLIFRAPSVLEDLYSWPSKTLNERRFFLRSETYLMFLMFASVCQTSSCENCLFQLSCMHHHYLSWLCLL